VVKMVIDITPDSEGLFEISELLSHDQVSLMRDFIDANMICLLDRSKFKPNTCLDGSVGNYRSMVISRETHPDIWFTVFEDMSINDIPLTSVMLNYYNKGDHISSHRDKQNNIYTVSTAVTDSSDCLVFETSTGDVICKDNPGVGYGFYGNRPVHRVPVVTSDSRVTLLLMYGN